MTSVQTNLEYTPVLNWWDLTLEERRQIIDRYDTIQESSFFRDRGRVYDLNNFMTANVGAEGWDARSYDVLIKLSECGEAVMVGRL